MPNPARPILVLVLWLTIILGVAFPPLWLIPIGIGVKKLADRHNKKARRRQQIEDDAARGRRMRGY